MKNNQNGFSAVELLIILVILGLIGGVGYYVYAARQVKNPQTNSANTTAHADTVKQKSTYKTPEGYTEYSNTELGFSIAYPSVWGVMLEPVTANAQTTVGTTNLKDYKFLGDASKATLSQSFSLTWAKKAGFEVDTGKYGATLQATQQNGRYIWKVVAVNPADTSDKVGATYSAKLKTNAPGASVYDFSLNDEGTFVARWILETKDSFVMVQLPTMSSPDAFLGGPTANSDVAAYNTLGKAVNDTLRLK